MSEQSGTGANDNTNAAPAKKKKYEKPAFRYERVFETMALSCGKTSPVSQNCKLRPQNS